MLKIRPYNLLFVLFLSIKVYAQDSTYLEFVDSIVAENNKHTIKNAKMYERWECLMPYCKGSYEISYYTDSSNQLLQVNSFNDSSMVLYDFQNERLIRVEYSTLPTVTVAYYYFQNNELRTILGQQNENPNFLKAQAAYFIRQFRDKKRK